tara:strand:- start:242 stop:433 length:192 start_codon:yes stop_codon:yes gene_type:complete
LNEELDMYGDPKKNCCVKNCTTKADLKEQSKYYCCDHYAQFILKMSLNDIKINKESGNSAATK